MVEFEEFRSSLRISDMLQYLDIYPIQLPARYANKFACYETVYITSNWSLEAQYRDIQQDSPETWNAFLRRIHEVRIYDSDGTITVYNSVEEYLNRKYEFHSLTEEEKRDTPYSEKETKDKDSCTQLELKEQEGELKP